MITVHTGLRVPSRIPTKIREYSVASSPSWSIVVLFLSSPPVPQQKIAPGRKCSAFNVLDVYCPNFSFFKRPKWDKNMFCPAIKHSLPRDSPRDSKRTADLRFPVDASAFKLTSSKWIWCIQNYNKIVIIILTELSQSDDWQLSHRMSRNNIKKKLNKH